MAQPPLLGVTISGLALFALLALPSSDLSAAAPAKWRGPGTWSEDASWEIGVPMTGQKAAIEGNADATFKNDAPGLLSLDIGSKPGSHSALSVLGGHLAALEFIRVGEYPGSFGRLLLDGGRITSTELGIGGMNEGDAPGKGCEAELEVRGGVLATRYLMLGWRRNSTAVLRVVGSRPAGIYVLNSFNCALSPKNTEGGPQLEFQLDANGVTPVTLLFPGEPLRLARKGESGNCSLKVTLLDAPPSGEITLVRSAVATTGTFVGLPEGAPIRATKGNLTVEWKLSYQGGPTKTHVVLRDPQLLSPAGAAKPYISSAKIQIQPPTDLQTLQSQWLQFLMACRDPNTQGLMPVPGPKPPAAFPGAEGFGAFAIGGRGGKLLVVSSLADSGPGTLREAVETHGPRTVVFGVGGVIELQKPIVIQEPYLTIAGQTAPGDGICLKGSRDTLTLRDTHDVVIRFLRVRTGYGGDKESQKGDCITCLGSHSFILDHCSTSWGTDETLSCSEGCDLYTVQWCIIAEALNFAGHSMASIAGGDRSSWHHNLFAHCRTRNPRFAAGSRSDFRNNLIYNWGDTSGYGDFGAINYAGNFLKPGPSTTQKPPRFLKPDGIAMPGAIFLDGNWMENAPDLSRDNRGGAAFDPTVFARTAHPYPAVETQTATLAAEQVLALAGATIPIRDPVDARLVSEVGAARGIIPNKESDVGGLPSYASGPVPKDSDGDGIPDAWETAHKLRPDDPSDALRLSSEGYTALEYYLNDLARPLLKRPQ